jgi:hypothetical protein
MGLDERDYLETRNQELAKELPNSYAGMEHGLSKEDAHVASLLGMTFADYAEAKKVEAQQRGKRASN